MPPFHAEDASCAICMDNLFHCKDDLDEVLPIATPDCGHVFHEPCLLNWFKTQAAQYVEQLRAQGVRIRGASPTEHDAPAECPSCRTEVYADPETGSPSLHRLFINWSEDGIAAGPSPSQRASMVGSSPARPNAADREVMNLARRARNVTAEVGALNPERAEDDVEGTLRRVDALAADAVSLKAAKGFKQYVGGLNAAINNLRDALETHPLIPVLQDRLHAAEFAHEQMRQALMEEQTLMVREAVQMERGKAEKAVKNANSARDVMERQLQRAQVEQNAFKRATKEREAEMEKRLGDARRALERQKADYEALEGVITDRTRQLKMAHIKLDSRKALKEEVERLRAENANLRNRPHQSGSSSSLHAGPSGSGSGSGSQPSQHKQSPKRHIDDLDAGNADMSLSDIIGTSRPSHRTRDEDDSLLIEMPSFDEDRRAAGRSTTARTFKFDMDDGLVRDTVSKNKSSKDKQKAKPVDRTASRDPARSKYFTSDTPSRPKTDKDVLVPASSPPAAKRSRTNPFSSMRAPKPVSYAEEDDVYLYPDTDSVPSRPSRASRTHKAVDYDDVDLDLDMILDDNKPHRARTHRAAVSFEDNFGMDLLGESDDKPVLRGRAPRRAAVYAEPLDVPDSDSDDNKPAVRPPRRDPTRSRPSIRNRDDTEANRALSSPARRILVMPDVEIVDIVSSDDAAPLLPRERPAPSAPSARDLALRSPLASSARTNGAAEMLGITAQGRLKRSVMTGPRVKRRA